MRIRFEGERKAHIMIEWGNSYWDAGFTLTKKELCSIFGIGEKWVRTYLSELPGVIYPLPFLQNKKGRGSTDIHFNREQVFQTIINMSTFTVQTMKLNLDPYFEEYPELKELCKLETYSEFIDELSKLVGYEVKPLIDRYRSGVNHIEIEPFNIDTKDYYIYAPNSDRDVSPELKYREAFKKGAILMKIVNNKTVFIYKRDNIYNYLTVPYKI